MAESELARLFMHLSASGPASLSRIVADGVMSAREAASAIREALRNGQIEQEITLSDETERSCYRVTMALAPPIAPGFAKRHDIGIPSTTAMALLPPPFGPSRLSIETPPCFRQAIRLVKQSASWTGMRPVAMMGGMALSDVAIFYRLPPPFGSSLRRLSDPPISLGGAPESCMTSRGDIPRSPEDVAAKFGLDIETGPAPRVAPHSGISWRESGKGRGKACRTVGLRQLLVWLACMLVGGGVQVVLYGTRDMAGVFQLALHRLQ